MLKVVTVYRTGGDYDPVYVKRLADGVKRSLKIPHEFICLSNDSEKHVGLKTIPLRHNWPGWWSKMEVFSLQGPLLYFDLDTVITGPIDELARWVIDNPGPLLMLRGFYRGDQCSGIMGWSDSFSWIYEQFWINFGDQAIYEVKKNGISMMVGGKHFRGDQEWLKEFYRHRFDQVTIVMVQDIMQGIVSYKVDVQPKGKLPTDAKIVCFHGFPRPAEIIPKPKWLEKYWLGN